jgi:tripartite-type tricarboxylate transporter receptor subunit TctC
MTFARRQFLRLVAASGAAPALSRIAWAEAFPSRPVRIIVGSLPGGTPDILARLMGQWLAERLGQPFIIENRPGAGGNTGTEAVVRAPADGYTLLLVTTANAINVTLYDKLNFNFIQDIAPVASIIRQPYVMLVHPSVPAKTVSEFIDYAKANPGRLNMASVGQGTGTHVAGELLKMMAGLNIVHVPYRGGAQPMTDLIAGQVQVMFSTLVTAGEHVKAGRLRALAVTTAMRSEALPDVPSVGDYIPGYEASAWFGIGVPKNTRAEIVDKLNREINAALADLKIKARLDDEGGGQLALSPADFGKLIAEETEKWAKVVRAANIRI